MSYGREASSELLTRVIYCRLCAGLFAVTELALAYRATEDWPFGPPTTSSAATLRIAYSSWLLQKTPDPVPDRICLTSHAAPQVRHLPRHAPFTIPIRFVGSGRHSRAYVLSWVHNLKVVCWEEEYKRTLSPGVRCTLSLPSAAVFLPSA